ncbi:TetR/AcrR family transcriptional regulator [Amycolatopsis sp. OK19-0408]|uniref:TetR/AcrR family transcriptional regulator n=1 Tax=Amycolatopsis iheyensis TaxID=2945988 RepID=A0A9X2NDA5_9PSEU|nr:TetR/AcrR family transcriptional regulator [Amycolatopsis iheyensis]MCR6485151.1 TetR/AcrR family transcriptional regulator [Amycolatopsis iheyensis]
MRAVRPSAAVPRRVDARRNREAILRAADEAFSEDADVVLDEVARRAGLGRATVYRHFPDRTALAFAVAAHHLAAFKNLVRGKESFRELLRAVLAMQARRRPLVKLFRELPEHNQRQYTQALVSLLRPAFESAQQEGSVRADLEPADLALLFEMHEAALVPGLGSREPAARLVRVFLDGLAAPAQLSQVEPQKGG